jgi:hypothetical protein
MGEGRDIVPSVRLAPNADLVGLGLVDGESFGKGMLTEATKLRAWQTKRTAAYSFIQVCMKCQAARAAVKVVFAVEAGS